MRSRLFQLLAVVVMVGALVLPSSARAAFLLCNHASAAVEAAFGYNEQSTWVSEGWWQIQPGQCARVYNKPLTQRFYFYYARVLTQSANKESRPPVWEGKYAFCVDSKAFRAEGDGNCEARGLRQQGFHEVDIGPNKRDYTLTFQDGGWR